MGRSAAHQFVPGREIATQVYLEALNEAFEALEEELNVIFEDFGADPCESEPEDEGLDSEAHDRWHALKDLEGFIATMSAFVETQYGPSMVPCAFHCDAVDFVWHALEESAKAHERLPPPPPTLLN